MNKKLILSWGVFAIMVIVATCLFFITKKPEEAPEYVLFYAENQTADYPTTLGAQRFAELVQERTGGRIHIIVESEAKLGAESEVLEQIKYGGIAFARVSLSQIAEQAPEMNVLQLPYLYRDSEHMWRVLDGEILRECARESAEYERVLWKDREEQSRQTAIANGTCVSTLSAEEKERGNQVPAYRCGCDRCPEVQDFQEG